jgi:DNA primase catalytic subunit
MLTRENLLPLFKEYYARATLSIDQVARREIAFLTWDNRMIRHQAHTNKQGILEFAQQRAPKAIYASLSQYLDPSYRVPKDSDKKSIDCQECGVSYKSDHSKASCPECKTENEKADVNAKDRRAMTLAFDIDYGDIPGSQTKAPKENLGAAARSTSNLATLLVTDLGFAPTDLHITFSGKKGFHIRVDTKDHPLFDSKSQVDESVRKGLLNYVSGYEFKIMDFIFVRAHSQSANTWHLKGYESGWGARFNESIQYLLKVADREEDFEKVLGLYSPWYEDKKKYGTKKTLPSPKVMKGFREACIAHRASILKGGNLRSMKDAEAKRLLGFALARTRLRYAAFVDKVVTADKARVLRIPGSIHGGSGMVCCEVPSIEHLSDMGWVLALQGEILGTEEVDVSISKVANTYYGVFEPGEHKVSRHIAIALLCAQG